VGAELFDADLAERYGWINRALPPQELDAFVDGLAKAIASRAPEWSVQPNKRSMQVPKI
jgi:enoyl-CoA hydratase/carnithine racemase